ncbi:hypothetical protein F5B22DRAFT_583096 [Xylaria bambusicola]|uniref:uncharacterized protein n=1 Tax=Xylaria bambusicola TaxID=326684 RepID=UPI002008BC24|nr:uncharacterized protein F5B22DRAFT_583096 [Xylaria bambusicola]KAI0527966.1 hypothetical protein F5B22DRAFT_583096 [Xylaria bambusicola]
MAKITTNHVPCSPYMIFLHSPPDNRSSANSFTQGYIAKKKRSSRRREPPLPVERDRASPRDKHQQEQAGTATTPRTTTTTFDASLFPDIPRVSRFLTGLTDYHYDVSERITCTAVKSASCSGEICASYLIGNNGYRQVLSSITRVLLFSSIRYVLSMILHDVVTCAHNDAMHATLLLTHAPEEELTSTCARVMGFLRNAMRQSPARGIRILRLCVAQSYEWVVVRRS